MWILKDALKSTHKSKGEDKRASTLAGSWFTMGTQFEHERRFRNSRSAFRLRESEYVRLVPIEVLQNQQSSNLHVQFHTLMTLDQLAGNVDYTGH